MNKFLKSFAVYNRKTYWLLMRIAVYYLQTEVVTMIYRPLYVEKIMAYVDTPFVKILTGVRRCGKSTILKMIMERLKTQRNIPDECIEIGRASCRERV